MDDRFTLTAVVQGDDGVEVAVEYALTRAQAEALGRGRGSVGVPALPAAYGITPEGELAESYGPADG